MNKKGGNDTYKVISQAHTIKTESVTQIYPIKECLTF